MIRDAGYALLGLFLLVVLVIAAWRDRGGSRVNADDRLALQAFIERRDPR